MIPTTLKQIADWADGRLIQGRPSDRIVCVSTDSRTAGPGDLFVALKGDRFDGHDFIDQVSAQGAVAILVSQLNLATERFPGAIIHVRQPLAALQELALQYRRSLPDLFVVGVTGSNGKTSTKDFLAAVLSRSGNVNATLGNLNNHIGLPLTVLRTAADHVSGVWEMGMSHPGEIEVLAEIARPDAAVITHVGTAHIEHMKTRDAIALEKGMLAEAVSESGFVVLPAADDYAESIARRCRARVIMVGIDCGEVRACDLRTTDRGIRFVIEADQGRAEVDLPVPGRHMVGNALLAAAVGLERGIAMGDVAAALSESRLTAGRLQRRRIAGIDFLDDSYNANPDSMRAAVNTLKGLETPGRRVAVLGRMAELGEHEAMEHTALGDFVADSGIDLLVTVGETAALAAQAAGGKMEVHAAADQVAAGAYLGTTLAAGDLVLVKGSRSSAMEKVIAALGGEDQGH